tara:strand:+ start:129 stop:329 length:201 start_codon:yes stop_codon:yes gene_type:complete
MSFIKMQLTQLLTAREQLMWDIDGIVDEFACNNNISEDDMEDLIRVLCDAVCKNFPSESIEKKPID